MPFPILYHPRFLEHRQPDAGHPERPERLVAIVDRLLAEGLWQNIVEPAAATDADLLCVHDAEYLDRLATSAPLRIDADTYLARETFAIARLAAGAALQAAEIAWRDGGPALALVRPPGHHATRSHAMGFCYLNSAAVAAAAHVAAGRGNVAIVDIDVHHGNGTQDIFYESGDVLYVSLHQSPFYPGSGSAIESGAGAGLGATINLPLPAGSGDAAYADAMDAVVLPALARFRPSLLIVSLGADAHAMDPLGEMQLTTRGYLAVLSRIAASAASLCEGRIVYLLEGGYHLAATADVIAGLAAMLADKPFAPAEFAPSPFSAAYSRDR